MIDAKRAVELYDTTLRDGAQRADLSYTIEDRLRILHRLDQVGFPYIEGGWPGANPRDTEFCACCSVSFVASRNNSVSRGFAPGQPPSIYGNPTWSSRCRMRSRSSTV